MYDLISRVADEVCARSMPASQRRGLQVPLDRFERRDLEATER